MQCPACQTTLPDGARFCTVCGAQTVGGAAILQQTVCAACGQPVKPGQKFCMICGAPVAIVPPVAVPTVPQPAQISPPGGAAAPAPPARRGKWWLWLIPLALVAALALAAIALDLPARLSQGAAAPGAQTARIEGAATATEVVVNSNELWGQAQERRAAGDWAGVQALLTQLRAADPEGTRDDAGYQPAEVSALLATACSNLARRAEQASDRAAASAAWGCVLQERPSDAEATAGQQRADLYLAAQAALVAGQYPEAIAAWSELGSRAPGYADVADRLYLAYLAYGDALCATGAAADMAAARKQYGLARGLAPARPEAIEKLRACQPPTATLQPTAPPTPTPTPLPGPHLGVITEDVTNLRVRSGPGAGYFVLGKLTAGDAVTITARSADAAWVQVAAAAGGQGWVSSEYVKANYPAAAAPAIDPPPLPARLLVAQASTDFSSEQGFREWFYLNSTGPGALKFVRMPFDADGTYRWCCNASYSSAMRVWRLGTYPSARHDAVRLWVNPYAGQIHISGLARKEPVYGAGGNGVLLRILQGEEVRWEGALGASDASSITFDLTVDAQPGDEFYFIVRSQGHDLGDSVLFDPTIELLHPDGVDSPSPVAWIEPTPVPPTPPPPPTAPPAQCFEPRLRHFEEHKGCCAEIVGLIYNRQGQVFKPRGAIMRIEGPAATDRYVHEFGVAPNGGYEVTALSVNPYALWLKGPNIRSRQFAVKFDDWAKIRAVVDWHQVTCW